MSGCILTYVSLTMNINTMRSWTRDGRQRNKHQRQRYILECVGREVWRNGNGGLADDINAPEPEVDAEVGRGPHIFFWIWWAGSRRTMSYVMSKILWKVRWLCWNHEPCFVDLDTEHLTPATFFRHGHLNPPGILGSADLVISGPQVLHYALIQRRPTSFRNGIAKPWSQNTCVRKFLFGPPSSRSIGRPYEDPRHERHFLQAFLVLVYHITETFHYCLLKRDEGYCTRRFWREEWLLHGYRKCVTLWVITKETRGKGERNTSRRAFA